MTRPVPGLATCADLLAWYAIRHQRLPGVTRRRRDVVRQVIGRRLLPHLGALPVQQLDRGAVLAMLAELEPGEGRQVWAVLRSALIVARFAGLLPVDHLGGMTWAGLHSSC